MTSPVFCPQCGKKLMPGMHAERERLACPDASCGYVFWDNPIPVVAAIIEQKGNVLLVRNQGWPEKMFALVTGFLERDESPEEGCLREIAEETGLRAEITELVGVYPFLPMNQVIIAYAVKAQGEVILGEELADFRWIPIEKVRPWPQATGQALARWLEKQGVDRA